MKKLLLSVLFLSAIVSFVHAQDEEKSEEKKGFKKENLFTGGNVSFGYGSAYGYSNFSAGLSPVFGYNITNWLDAGIALNYNYQAFRPTDINGNAYDYKIRQSNYGGGTFVKIYPIHSVFLQAQYEHNFTHQKYIFDDGEAPGSANVQTNSFLIGGGYAARLKGWKQPFFFIAVLFDISGNPFTPYTDYQGRAIPIIRGGVQIPLFQGKQRDNRSEYDEPRSGGKRARNYNGRY
ncbi:MAG: hypothetical protein QM764_14955 [Chitinophagaceae bacterium]